MQLWREKNKYITKYVDKYDWFMILITVFAGFYAALEIAQSRLFYWNVFGMQINLRENSDQKSLRFLNNVLLELSTYCNSFFFFLFFSSLFLKSLVSAQGQIQPDAEASVKWTICRNGRIAMRLEFDVDCLLKILFVSLYFSCNK